MSNWFIGICFLLLVMSLRQTVLRNRHPRVSNALTTVCEWAFLLGMMERAIGYEQPKPVIFSAWLAALGWMGFRYLTSFVWGPTRRMTDWKIIIFKRSVLLALLYVAIGREVEFVDVLAAFVAVHMWVLLKAAYIDTLRLDKLVTLDTEGKGVQYIAPPQRRKTDKQKQIVPFKWALK